MTAEPTAREARIPQVRGTRDWLPEEYRDLAKAIAEAK